MSTAVGGDAYLSLSSDSYITSATDAKLDLKAPLANHTFTGTVTAASLFVDGGDITASIHAKQGTLRVHFLVLQEDCRYLPERL